MASISDKITKTMDGQTPNTTTVSTQRVAGATELQARNLDGWPEDTAVHFTTYRVDSQGEVIDGSETDWKGIVSRSANTIANLTRTGGAADQGNAADDVIEPMPTAAWGNELAEALLECHTTEGNLKTKSVALTSINGGAKAGIFKTDANGTVSSVAKLPAENIDLTTFPKTPYMIKAHADKNGQVLGGNTNGVAKFTRVISQSGDIEATANGIKVKKAGLYSIKGYAAFGDAPNGNTHIRVVVKSESEGGEVKYYSNFEKIPQAERWFGVNTSINMELEANDVIMLEVNNRSGAPTRVSQNGEDGRIYQFGLSAVMVSPHIV